MDLIYAPDSKEVSFFQQGAEGYLEYHYERHNRWNVDKSSFLIGGPVHDNIIAGFYERKHRHPAAIYRGQDGYLRYYYMHNGWKLQTLTRVGRVTGQIAAAYNKRNQPFVCFRGRDGYMHYATIHRKRWIVNNRSFRGLGKVGGRLAAIATPRGVECFFQGADGYVKRAYHNGRWRLEANAFRAGGKMQGDLSVIYARQRKHTEIFYRGVDGYLRYYFMHRRKWTVDARTFRRPAHRVAGPISAVFANQRNHSEVMYRGVDGYIHYFFLNRRGWQVDARTFRKWKVNGALGATFSPKQNHTAVVYLGADAAYHHYYIQGRWRHKLHRQTPVSGIGITNILGQLRGGTAVSTGVHRRVARRSIRRGCITKSNLRFAPTSPFTYRVQMCGASINGTLSQVSVRSVYNEQLKITDNTLKSIFLHHADLRTSLDRKFQPNVRRRTRSRTTSTSTVINLDDIVRKIKKEVERAIQKTERNLRSKARHLVESLVKAGGKAAVGKPTLLILKKITSKVAEMVIKEIKKPVTLDQFFSSSQHMLAGVRAKRVAAKATRINALITIAAGLALEVAAIPADVFLYCSGYSGAAKKCCVENRLTYNLVGLSFVVTTVILQAIVDAALIQPMSQALAAAIAGTAAAATLGLGAATQPIAHFLISTTLNVTMAITLLGWRFVFDQATKPLIPHVRPLVARVLSRLPSNLPCQGPCSPDNGPAMCKKGNSNWNFKKLKREEKRAKGMLRSRTICLRSKNGNKYVSADNNRRTLRANKSTCGANETLTLEYYDLGGKDSRGRMVYSGLRHGMVVYLKTRHNRYWTAHKNETLTADGTTRGAAQQFVLFALTGKTKGKMGPNGEIALLSTYDKYVVGLGREAMRADRTGRSTWETFHMSEKSNNQFNRVCFLNHSRKFIIGTPPSGLIIKASQLTRSKYPNLVNLKKFCTGWERHFLERVNKRVPLRSGDWVYIRTNYGKYWSAKRLTGIMVGNITKAQAWERFRIFKVGVRNGTPIAPGGRIHLQSAHGKWVSAESGGGSFLIANRGRPSGWETFHLIMER
tara:strand:+ start:820 stop:3957 length:3138 start_codon:yes stop_codon:yes gene_type:complete